MYVARVTYIQILNFELESYIKIPGPGSITKPDQE